MLQRFALSLPRLGLVSLILVILANAAIAQAPPRARDGAASTGATIGLTLTGWRYAFVETPGYDECGGSLDPGPHAQA